MSTSLSFLTAFAAVIIFHLACDAHTTAQDNFESDRPFLQSLIGYKPCLDNDCGTYGRSHLKTAGTKIDYEPQDPPAPIPGKPEDPKVHCIFLRPSAIKMFKELENVYPEISEIKYSVLEDIISYMYSFSTVAFGSCEPNMKLLDLVILAANSLKAQYQLEGAKDCVYESYEVNSENPSQSEQITEMPCNSESCYETTKKPKAATSMSTEKSYEPTSTEQTKEKPYIPTSTERSYKPSSTEKPYFPSSEQPSQKKVNKRCPDDVTTEKPCQSDYVTEEYSHSEVEIVAEHMEPKIPQVGSMKGIPGVHYPNLTDIPITTFSCADKKYIPGFYADPETGCQVFHVCYEHRRESFLCPVGTIFNQPILACDYWYSSNCSLAPTCYDVNEKTHFEEDKIDVEVEELLTSMEENSADSSGTQSVDADLEEITPFFPVKAVVVDKEPEVKIKVESSVSDVEEIAEEIVHNIATTGTKVISGARHIVKSIPEPVVPKPVFKPVIQTGKKILKLEDLLAKSVIPLAKAKLAAIPVAKVTALKTAVPVATLAAKVSIPAVAAKAKLATKAAAIPFVKAAVAAPVLAKSKMAVAPVIAKAKIAAVPAAKVAVAAPVLAKAKIAAMPVAKVAVAAPVLAKAKVAAIPAAKMAVAAPVIAKGKLAVPAVKVGAAKVAVKSSLPVLKAKMVASAVPLAKTKLVPLKVKTAGAPFLKAKMLALPLAKTKLAGPIPLAKVKLAKAAAISPLTKKALALGYMKLLKAKKIALMG